MRNLEAQLAQQRSMQAMPLVQGQAPPGQVVQGQGAQDKDPKKRSWDTMVKDMKQEARQRSPEEQRQEDARDLIHAAKWAIPGSPLRTIYRSQTLTGKLLQAMSSDIPGQVKIQLTTPVLDKFGWDTVIVPKDTIVIASQEGGTIRQGQNRLSIRLEQLEFPSGEIVNLKASIGDQDGANGLKGVVDSHIGKILLATGLSAILNIGVRTAAGTPGRGEHFEDPIQESARDVGASVQRDAQSIVDRQLRIPPTVTISSNTPCTINLQENVQFSRGPTIVR
jgi:type IV secretory pathway VirB10-like protein